MSPARSGVNVAALPTTVFGPRALLWWGTLSFMVIEGTTLFICVAAYLYLWRNFPTWPPEHTPRPSLLWPTIGLAVLLVSNIPLLLADKAARRLDVAALRRWMLVALVFAFAFGTPYESMTQTLATLTVPLFTIKTQSVSAPALSDAYLASRFRRLQQPGRLVHPAE